MLPNDAVLVSRDLFERGDATSLVAGVVAAVADQLDRYFTIDEIAPDARRAYYLDYYLVQRVRGGFSQFVFNSGWAPSIVASVREGLAAIGANEHAARFEADAALVDELPDLGAFLASDYFAAHHPERDALDANETLFDAIAEDAVERIAVWLRSLPHLIAREPEALIAELDRRAAALPDLEARIARAQNDEPDVAKLVRSLCRAADHELLGLTAFDEAFSYEGTVVPAVHFETDRGPRMMLLLQGRVRMIDATRVSIAELEPGDFGL